RTSPRRAARSSTSRSSTSSQRRRDRRPRRRGGGGSLRRRPGRMRIVRAAREAEVVAAFLRAELESPRWGARLQAFLDEDARDAAVLQDPGADAYRAELLDRHRGWLRREGLFAGLP